MSKYSDITMLFKIFETIEYTVKDADYVISYDTLEHKVYTYILSRFIGDKIEVLFEKSHRINDRVNIESFVKEIELLSKLFNASVTGDKKLNEL